MSTIDAECVATLAHNLTLMDTLAQEQSAAFAASQTFEDGAQVLTTLQAAWRVHASAFAELLACWHGRTEAQDNAFDAGMCAGKLLGSLPPVLEPAPGAMSYEAYVRALLTVVRHYARTQQTNSDVVCGAGEILARVLAISMQTGGYDPEEQELLLDDCCTELRRAALAWAQKAP